MPLPRTPEQVTATVLVVNFIALVLYNVAVRVYCGECATISVVLSSAVYRWPIIGVGIGILIGHWFWNIR